MPPLHHCILSVGKWYNLATLQGRIKGLSGVTVQMKISQFGVSKNGLMRSKHSKPVTVRKIEHNG